LRKNHASIPTLFAGRLARGSDAVDHHPSHVRETKGRAFQVLGMRRTVIAGTIFCWLAVRVFASDLTFLVVGDWGTGSPDQRKVAVQMGKTAEAIGARFVVSTGDNFYPSGVKNVDDPQWKTSFENIYTMGALSIPWYAVLGNHDHRGNIKAQVQYSERSSRWRMPATYYKRTENLADGSSAELFFLDSDTIIKDYRSWRGFFSRPKQVRWLERALATSVARWKIVVAHHPVFSGGSHKETRALVVLVRPLLERYGVQVYLNGHNHNLEHVVIGKVHYLTSGAGSRPRKARTVTGSRFVAGGRLGIMTAQLTPDAMAIEFIDDEGASLYRVHIPVTQ
jgi:tartrate-resistant acid phosphatase type 5